MPKRLSTVAAGGVAWARIRSRDILRTHLGKLPKFQVIKTALKLQWGWGTADLGNSVLAVHLPGGVLRIGDLFFKPYCRCYNLPDSSVSYLQSGYLSTEVNTSQHHATLCNGVLDRGMHAQGLRSPLTLPTRRLRLQSVHSHGKQLLGQTRREPLLDLRFHDLRSQARLPEKDSEFIISSGTQSASHIGAEVSH
jgi:hypothetical protein